MAKRITLSPVSSRATTDESGLADLAICIPGVFTGMQGFKDEPDNGRYLKRVRVRMKEDHSHENDWISNMRVEDRDRLLATALAASISGPGSPALTDEQVRLTNPLLPNYPVLMAFQDPDIVETADFRSGYELTPGEWLEMEVIAPNPMLPATGFEFIPSGMYLCADVQSGLAAAGKIVRAQLVIGRMVNL